MIGRIGRIVPFRPLSPEAIRLIIKDRLDASLAGIRTKGELEITYGDEVVEEFAATVLDARYGVREIDALIYEKLSPALAAVSKERPRGRKRGRLVVDNEVLSVLS